MTVFKNRAAALLACLAALLAPSAPLCPPAAAYNYQEETVEKNFLIKTRVRYWFAQTSAQTRSHMLTPSWWWTPPSDTITIGRTDDFKKMDSSFPLFSAEVQPLPGFSLDFEVGDNRFSGGKMLQKNWLHATNQILYLYNGVTWDSPQHRDYAVSRAQTTGTARQYSANAYLRVYKSRKARREDDYELNHTMDLFAGYSWYETRVHIFNGYKTVSTDFFLPTPPVGPMTGLDSSSKMIWNGWRFGFREQAKIADDFTAECKFAFGPRLHFRGQDYWNLRSDLRNPGVRHEARGVLVEVSASAAWKFWKQFQLEGGYLAWVYSAASGSETYYYTDGTEWEGKLNKVKATRKGLFLALSWKY